MVASVGLSPLDEGDRGVALAGGADAGRRRRGPTHAAPGWGADLPAQVGRLPALAWTGPDRVALQSRHGRALTRFFPDLCRVLADTLPSGLVLDGELIVWDDARGRTSFTHLQQLLTAGRRVPIEAAYPAYFGVFDLLQDIRGRVLLDQPLTRRRRRLDRLLAGAPPQLPLCPQTTDESTARGWWADWAITGVTIRSMRVATGAPPDGIGGVGSETAASAVRRRRRQAAAGEEGKRGRSPARAGDSAPAPGALGRADRPPPSRVPPGRRAATC